MNAARSRSIPGFRVFPKAIPSALGTGLYAAHSQDNPDFMHGPIRHDRVATTNRHIPAAILSGTVHGGELCARITPTRNALRAGYSCGPTLRGVLAVGVAPAIDAGIRTCHAARYTSGQDSPDIIPGVVRYSL